MAVHKNSLEKSRLGRLLVNRGYITESQLNQALQEQQQHQMRLGELLIEKGWISEKELSRTLKHQSRYRYTAAFVAMAVTPLQPLVALAASTPVQAVPVKQIENSQQRGKGLRPLDEMEMGLVSAQGIQQDVVDIYSRLQEALVDEEALKKLEEEGGLDGVEVVGSIGKIFFPIANVLDADVEVEGVHIEADRIKPLMTEDGYFNVTLPNRIERVSFNNIRPMGQVGGATMGSVHLDGIEFSDEAFIRIRTY
ncbi:type II secretion protein ATPase [Hahella sp. CCB-MM4]|uniref:type II secretion protein ATPase n=1 Tax=Hahella sp. (strain CCB-MM4) TaxID=1926491 RepID=UPI000B9AE528|nr:type II secretion protein ATPase [Hahella sp. CCB-MM4]OZG71233.1 type II secretion protein ATPase [Hahella sp. CCB-MM4]